MIVCRSQENSSTAKAKHYLRHFVEIFLSALTRRQSRNFFFLSVETSGFFESAQAGKFPQPQSQNYN